MSNISILEFHNLPVPSCTTRMMRKDNMPLNIIFELMITLLISSQQIIFRSAGLQMQIHIDFYFKIRVHIKCQT